MREFRLTLSHHQDGKISGVDRRVPDAGENQRHAADVVEVSMSDDERAYFIFTLFEVGRIWDDIVHSRGSFIGKMHTGVNDDNVFADFYRGHILADFFYTAEWNNPNYSFLG